MPEHTPLAAPCYVLAVTYIMTIFAEVLTYISTDIPNSGRWIPLNSCQNQQVLA